MGKSTINKVSVDFLRKHINYQYDNIIEKFYEVFDELMEQKQPYKPFLYDMIELNVTSPIVLFLGLFYEMEEGNIPKNDIDEFVDLYNDELCNECEELKSIIKEREDDGEDFSNAKLYLIDKKIIYYE